MEQATASTPRIGAGGGRASLLLATLAASTLACASTPTEAPAPPDARGTEIARFSLEDQHGDEHTVDALTAVIVYSRDMDAGDVVRPVLEPLGDAFLVERRAVYVADISRMPGFISNAIAIPRMRGRSFATLLDREGTLESVLPNMPGRASVIRLDQLRIVEVRYAASEQELRDALGL